MPRGGYRPNSGRKKGQAGLLSRKLANEAAAKGLSPMAFALAVLNDPQQPNSRRDAMAAMLMPYCHPRLAAEPLPAPVVNTMMTVNVVSVPSGTFLSKDEVDTLRLQAMPDLIEDDTIN